MALSITSNQQTLGNDGPWYTFPVRLGSKADTVFLLPSTSTRQILAVLTEGCDSEFYGTTDPDCSTKRGNLISFNASSTFIPDTASTGSIISLPFETEQSLGASAPPPVQVEVGQDTVGFGFSGNISPLTEQLVAGYVTADPYLGLLPLSPYNATPANLADTHYSIVGVLNTTGKIPTTSWAYNAGAPYHDPPAFGSLTLGGYDSLRGNVDNVLEAPMQTDTQHDLVIAITSIVLGTTSIQNKAQSLPITALLDSTVPEIWLPTTICTLFEETFGIVWNDTVGMYLVDDTLHQTLTSQNATVTFSLAANITSAASDTIDITLPYGSFDLTASFPLAGIQDATTTQRYFPLQRAQNESQVFLGRTFFQEAYISTNYKQRVFNVSQAIFNPTSTLLVTIEPYTTQHPKVSGVSGGAIAGIVIGSIAGLAIIAGILVCLWRRHRHERSIRGWALNIPKPFSEGATSTTIDVSHENSDQQVVEELYKPPAGPEDDPSAEPKFERSELDATTTVRPRQYSYIRTELPTSNSVRRTSDQSHASRPSISPLDQRASASRIGHMSFGSAYSALPSDYNSPPLGPIISDRAGSPRLFELHGHSRGPSDASLLTTDSELVEADATPTLSDPGSATHASPAVTEQARPGESTRARSTSYGFSAMVPHVEEADEAASPDVEDGDTLVGGDTLIGQTEDQRKSGDRELDPHAGFSGK